MPNQYTDTIPLEERFWPKVQKGDGPDACWLWTAFTPDGRYGRIQVDGKPRGAHVVAWEMENGPVPDGLIVCHTCDVMRCVRNDGANSHLFVGTNADNSADMVAKGRQARGAANGVRLHPESLIRGDAHWTRRHPERLPHGDDHWMREHGAEFAGEANPHAKLTWDDVRSIRRRHAENPYRGFLTHVASEYGVTPTAIYEIIHRKSWLE